MKILKLCLTVLITGACALSAHAQKQLKYVPQALKGAKAVPYVVKPQFSVRAQFTVPVVRPNAATSANVSAAVERQVATKVAMQERMAKLEKNLDALEKYARTHGRHLPRANSNIAEGSSLRTQVITDIATLKRCGFLEEEHPLSQRYRKLVEAAEQQRAKEKVETRIAWKDQRALEKLARKEQQEQEKLARAQQRDQERQARAAQELRAKQARAQQREQDKLARKEQQLQEEQFFRELRAQEQAAEQRAWEQVLLQDAAWKAQPEEMADPTENAKAAARLVEEQIAFPGVVPTDDYIDQLLQFYNKLDPTGTGIIQ